MPVLGEIQGATTNVKLWAPIEEVESQAVEQLRNIASWSPRPTASSTTPFINEDYEGWRVSARAPNMHHLGT